ncbi:isochorismatase family cysteine hydrolase [Neobacillus mesonae]|uniref:isochorismatase family cysteine hydrolase n=1 Tax=Neobacillus mesonae TaxID=1193713 RepID=UPI002573B289|nr:isochorismatase family cysteine hydrolase [Neobacillus mesonae]MED4207547.1 cysteine hydrolase [Neobacillus mesonae]
MKKPKTALIIIDMINNFDFPGGSVLAQKARIISQSINRLKDQFNQVKLPVIFINDHYNLWQADYQKIIQYCSNRYSDPIMNQLLPGEDDYFLIKPKHSAFYGTALNTLLHQLKVDTLVLTGIAGNICVLFTANDAYMREFELLVPSDCLASVSEDDNQYALTMMKNVLKARIEPSSHEIYHHYIMNPPPSS